MSIYTRSSNKLMRTIKHETAYWKLAFSALSPAELTSLGRRQTRKSVAKNEQIPFVCCCVNEVLILYARIRMRSNLSNFPHRRRLKVANYRFEEVNRSISSSFLNEFWRISSNIKENNFLFILGPIFGSQQFRTYIVSLFLRSSSLFFFALLNMPFVLIVCQSIYWSK